MSAREGTLTATTDKGKLIHFDDFVYDGDVVAVFRTARGFESGNGLNDAYRVVWDDDDWALRPLTADEVQEEREKLTRFGVVVSADNHETTR